MTTANEEILLKLFKEEYSKMTAVICRHFGVQNIQFAEDIVSDTFLKATELWHKNGLPPNPTAWLYVVAQNKVKDLLKHDKVKSRQIIEQENTQQLSLDVPFSFEAYHFEDSQLLMFFVLCSPMNSIESQICLALQILCGFTLQEIANAFMCPVETIKKRLVRAKKKLRDDNFQIKILNTNELSQRLPSVLKTLYLFYNEGYFSKTNENIIRKELCGEAMRLTHMLLNNTSTNTSLTKALMSLMCFQSSRFDARTSTDGVSVLFDQQNQGDWNQELIHLGNYYLIEACSIFQTSTYHLEASIAYWHTQTNHPNKWSNILQLYNQLLIMEYTPFTALNRTFAFAKVYGYESAIIEANKLKLEQNIYFHSLLGYLYSKHDIYTSIYHYEKAISLSRSSIEKSTLLAELNKLKDKL